MSTAAQRLARARALESLARDIAREEILPRYLKSARNRKADGTLFTEADLESQRRFSEALPQLIPGPVLGEEMTAEEQARLWSEGRRGLWCIDPIDGTTNFANGIPFFAVSIAYLVDHEPRFGVVYNPITDESFYAAQGAGAYLNGAELPLRPAAARLADAVAGVDFKRISHHLGDELAVRPPYYSQRNFGSSALEWCFVAAGRLDVYIHGGQMLWDYAAGRLILAEAGGEAAALDGGSLMAGPAVKRAVVAAASPALFTEWRTWLQSHS
ncbi:inositol monophosphatase [Azoarcus indigens]|uniref:3'(2'), 5'-bisphosphate nucleotidase/myo-inositol-1(Or 4)-monophosphatase n=1 Tax=Azoarcus indigens TaxID=29545 RepID=A0A4R6DUS8_9RHOO|nr:inositol monophosphatase [Azoarcus indigens]NMG65046.1 inositol monophosphatase [Azoarcus indigens]TDN48941.1 3'(2'), 5'-bisphosphate nucleotidase/myo-inositol-1(or 4)-monophosphatase [Azoarcus indigens]